MWPQSPGDTDKPTAVIRADHTPELATMKTLLPFFLSLLLAAPGVAQEKAASKEGEPGPGMQKQNGFVECTLTTEYQAGPAPWTNW